MGKGGRGKGRKGLQGGKGKGKGSGVQSIYQNATGFMSAFQQDLLAGLTKEDIVVVPGSADKVETVLNSLNMEYTTLNENQIGGYDFKPTQAVFVNCCANCREGSATRLKRHMESGGVVVTTDHEGQHCLEKCFPGVLQHVPLSGNHDAKLTEVDAEHPASRGFPLNANWHIDGGAHGMKVLDASKVKVLIKSPDVKEQNVVLDIPCGKGRAIHLISHFEQVSRHMNQWSEETTPVEIAQLAEKAGVALSDKEIDDLVKQKVGFRQLQTAIAGITMLVNVLLISKLQKLVLASTALAQGDAVSPQLELSKELQLLAMGHSPFVLKSDVSADGRVQKLRELVTHCMSRDVSFPLKVAVYLRRHTQHRETALCLFVLVALDGRASGSVSLAAPHVIREPGSLVRVRDWAKSLNDKKPLSSGLKKGITKAFNQRVNAQVLSKLDDSTKAGLKAVIKECHISAPQEEVLNLLGKRYPVTEAEWTQELNEPFDAEKAGRRRKITRDANTAAVQLSAAGKEGDEAKEKAWEELLLSGQVAPKELVRNLASIQGLELSEAARAEMIKQLQSKRCANQLNTQQLYVAWREVSDSNVKDALEKAAASKRRDPLSARRVVVLLDVSPSMSRPAGGGTSSISCKEAGAFLAFALRRAWKSTKGSSFTLRTFPGEMQDLDVDSFKAATEADALNQWPKDEGDTVPWTWLKNDTCGESELVILMTDTDYTPYPVWQELAPHHHSLGRTWFQARCVNLRGSPSSEEAILGAVINGCDDSVLQQILRPPEVALQEVKTLVFEPLPKEAAYSALVLLRTQYPGLTKSLLKHILDFAAPATSLHKKQAAS